MAAIALCQCGCGEPAPIANRNSTKRGYVKGQPKRFIRGHVGNMNPKRDLYTRSINDSGYAVRYVPSHPRASKPNGRVREHILVAEQALGKPLPARAEVHHINGVRDDNRHSNLVICQDHAYHMSIHRHARIKAAGGDPFTDAICRRCGVRPLTAFYNTRWKSFCKPCSWLQQLDRGQRRHAANS